MPDRGQPGKRAGSTGIAIDAPRGTTSAASTATPRKHTPTRSSAADGCTPTPIAATIAAPTT